MGVTFGGLRGTGHATGRLCDARPMEPRISAIVLAGGRSTRFGADKRAAEVDGRSLLERAIAAVAGVADETLVVIEAEPVAGSAAFPGQERPGRPGGPPDPVAAALAVHPAARLVRDGIPDAGPLAGFLAGAWAARHPRLLVVAGDQPWLVPAVLALLAGRVADDGPAAVRGLPVPDAARLAARGPDEDAAPLPFAARREPAVVTAERLLGEGARSLRALLHGLAAETVPEAAWRALDPAGATLRDVDRPADLPG